MSLPITRGSSRGAPEGLKEVCCVHTGAAAHVETSGTTALFNPPVLVMSQDADERSCHMSCGRGGKYPDLIQLCGVHVRAARLAGF